MRTQELFICVRDGELWLHRVYTPDGSLETYADDRVTIPAADFKHLDTEGGFYYCDACPAVLSFEQLCELDIPPTEIWWAVEDYFLKFRQDCREQSGVTEAIEKAVKAVENQFKKS